MTLVGKLVNVFEMKASAHKFYKVFKDDVSNIPDIIAPNSIQKVEVHEGNWDTHGHGSIKIWNYNLDGKVEVFKERVEFDDEKLAVTMIGLEGEVFKHYKSYTAIYQVVPKGPEHSLTILTIEYEKLDDGSPYPYKYMELITNFTKEIESHLKK